MIVVGGLRGGYGRGSFGCSGVGASDPLAPSRWISPVQLADAVAVGVLEGLVVQLAEDGVLVPKRVIAYGRSWGGVRVRNEARRAWCREGVASE
jgi:hypothetical protein